MLSSAFCLSNSISLPNLRSKASNPDSFYRFNPIPQPLPSKSVNFNAVISSTSSSRRLPLISCSSSSPRLGGWFSAPSPVPERKSDGFEVKSTAVPESTDDEDAAKSKMSETLVLGSLFGLWYLFNIYFNIYNKQARFVLPSPLFI